MTISELDQEIRHSSALPPLILSLQFDQSTFERLDALRSQYFPPERNVVPAHVTLFHALPGEQELSIRQILQEECAATPTVQLVFPQVRFLGRGVAVEVDSPELVQLRTKLATLWQPWLGAQDRQRYRPHVTVQNKVAPDVARSLYEQLNDSWHPFTGEGTALTLWYYLGGPWEQVETFSFLK